MDFLSILDAAKQASGSRDDSELAGHLGVSKQAVSSWRHQGKLPNAVTCATIAGLTGIPLAKVLGVVGEARAISREEKAVWRKLAAAAGAVLLLVGMTRPALAADVQSAEGGSTPYTLCEVQDGPNEP